jgi:hypothetical protein
MVLGPLRQRWQKLKAIPAKDLFYFVQGTLVPGVVLGIFTRSWFGFVMGTIYGSISFLNGLLYRFRRDARRLLTASSTVRKIRDAVTIGEALAKLAASGQIVPGPNARLTVKTTKAANAANVH